MHRNPPTLSGCPALLPPPILPPPVALPYCPLPNLLTVTQHSCHATYVHSPYILRTCHAHWVLARAAHTHPLLLSQNPFPYTTLHYYQRLRPSPFLPTHGISSHAAGGFWATFPTHACWPALRAMRRHYKQHTRLLCCQRHCQPLYSWIGCWTNFLHTTSW